MDELRSTAQTTGSQRNTITKNENTHHHYLHNIQNGDAELPIQRKFLLTKFNPISTMLSQILPKPIEPRYKD